MIIIKCSNCLINLQGAKIVLIVLIAKTLDENEKHGNDELN